VKLVESANLQSLSVLVEDRTQQVASWERIRGRVVGGGYVWGQDLVDYTVHNLFCFKDEKIPLTLGRMQMCHSRIVSNVSL
jgi:hypothetical protein